GITIPPVTFLVWVGLCSSVLVAVSDAVSGPARGSLTVQCRYEPGWETHSKWWCREVESSKCYILVRTNGSEQEVKGDRVSIKDDQKLRTFTVTMEKLRWDDADSYWCGIERSGTDLGVEVKVTIDPGKSMCVCGVFSISFCASLSTSRYFCFKFVHST
uniref:Ig-like domain-containing protein n=1 Tax=Ursus americanus TaxID=9643 RepID=A0A452QXK0_URSAM